MKSAGIRYEFGEFTLIPGEHSLRRADGPV